MKKTTKTKAATAADQLTLDSLVDAVNTLTQSVNLLVSGTQPTKAARPTLKWFEQEPQPITWSIHVDPATLILTPGTTLRYHVDTNTLSTYDGVVIGKLEALGHKIISIGIERGAKLHVYLTTGRKLGIKLGHQV